MSLINYTGVELGSEKDLDVIYREMGFDSTVVLAEFTTVDGEKYTAFTLGEQRILGLPETDREGDIVSDEPEYILENLEELRESDCFSNSCWISIDCENDKLLDFRISDELVTDSLEDFYDFMKCLDTHLTNGGTHQSFWDA